MSLTDTPNANRLHIALFGRRNSGKSSLINALTGQDTALVSDTPGTTTDPVAKAMEIHGIGPCLFFHVRSIRIRPSSPSSSNPGVSINKHGPIP